MSDAFEEALGAKAPPKFTPEQLAQQAAFNDATKAPAHVPAPSAFDVVLIDLSSIYWQQWHATGDMELSEAFKRTVDLVHRYRDGYAHVAVCCDAPPYKRAELLPEYKANRAASPPLAREQLKRIKERLRADGLLLWEVDGFEADDLLCAASMQALSAGHTVRVVSSDKDLHQLVCEGLTVQSPMSGAVYDETAVHAKHGVMPEMMVDFLAMCGDKSDNVPGVPGIGPVTAAALLKHFGSLGAILDAAARDDAALTKPKIKQALKDHADAARLSAKVIALRIDAPVNWKDIYVERKQEPLTEVTGDPDDGNVDLDEGAHAAQIVTQPAPQAQAAMVVRSEWSLGLEPHSLGAAHKIAQYLHESRLYTKFANPEAILAVIIRGRELGLGLGAALDNFHIIEGRPSPYAHLLIARAMEHPDCEYFQFASGDDTYAEWTTKNRRNPKPTTLRYTIAQAKQAGVCPAVIDPLPPVGAKDSRGQWSKRPSEMLRKTAGVQLVRLEYPSASQGLYAVEELER